MDPSQGINRYFLSCRWLRKVAAWWFADKPRLDFSHFDLFLEKHAIGPLQRDEAVLLYGLLRVLRSETIVEFGFFRGASAFNFLQAVELDARVYSFDPTETAQAYGIILEKLDKRFRFFKKSMVDFEWEDIDKRPIDFCFFDAAHVFGQNIAAFLRIQPHLTEHAFIAVHDTGTWSRAHMEEKQRAMVLYDPSQWLDEESYAHRTEERRFINWIQDEFPDYQILHFHSMRTLRHGLTLLQRRQRLPV